MPYNLLHQLLKIIHVADGVPVIQVDTAIMKDKPINEKVTGTDFRILYILQMKFLGNDGFTFDYKVQWPLSLIISRKSLTKYQLIFRLLYLCKRMERILNGAWAEHQSIKELEISRVLSGTYR